MPKDTSKDILKGETQTNQTPGKQLEDALKDMQPEPEIASQTIADIAKPKPRKPKPLVEGINAPKSTSDVFVVKPPPVLTEQENKLIRETPDSPLDPKVPIAQAVQKVETKKFETAKLMPDSVVERAGRKSGAGKKVVIFLIIILAIGFAGYEFYKSGKLNTILDSFKADSKPVAVEPDPMPYPNPAVMPDANSTPAQATSTPANLPPPASLVTLKIKSTPTGFLNFRAGPSLNDKIITKVYPGEIYPYSQLKNGWYNITLTDGRTGWVYSQYVTAQ